MNCNCDLKICDFGLARAEFPKISKPGQMTEYISTRWYRAPELLIGKESYSYPSNDLGLYLVVDMWSIGCIFAELLMRKPLMPGSDAENQLELIVNAVGKPPAEVLEKFSACKNHLYVHEMPQR